MEISINGKFIGEKQTLSYRNSINYYTNGLELLSLLKCRDLSFQKHRVKYMKYYELKKNNPKIMIRV